jgi:predicted RNA-binding Zn-ribbon protein involved in translation (DUF1610 family)
VPLDSQGYLRRACPTCSRELKWRADPCDQALDPDGEYFCPYCGIRSPANSWWTEAQLRAARAEAVREIVDPQLQGTGPGTDKTPPGFFAIDLEAAAPDPDPAPLNEPDDMRVIDFPCHPGAPIKVFKDWSRTLHCPVCGNLSWDAV